MAFIHSSASIKNSNYEDVKIYRNAVLHDSAIGKNCSVGDDSTIERCVFEDNVVINRRNYINDCTIGKFSYTGLNTIMRFTKVGRFCSFAPNVDVGGVDHDYKKVTTLPEFRYKQMVGGKVDVSEQKKYGCIGSDVWVATGAIILRKCRVGDGAIIGAGAVVTHDVPAYAIVAGVPAKVIGYRFPAEHIERLLKIQWWNWPDDVLGKHLGDLIHSDVDDETLTKMEEISSMVFGKDFHN